MYRLADYVCFDASLTRLVALTSFPSLQANLPDLKHIAKEGIKKALSEWNVVGELFSRFTSR
jgi:hypothetical protein